MKQLLLKYLRPYRRRLGLLAFLVLVQSVGNLYLPTLNADIINNGVAKGDTGYILRTGLIMLGVALLVGVCSVTNAFNVARTAMGFGRDVQARPLPKGRELLPERGRAASARRRSSPATPTTSSRCRRC